MKRRPEQNEKSEREIRKRDSRTLAPTSIILVLQRSRTSRPTLYTSLGRLALATLRIYGYHCLFTRIIDVIKSAMPMRSVLVSKGAFMTDAKQDAVLRCLKAGYAVDEQNPYAGRHFYAALRCAKIDEARVRAREERRSVRHLNHEKLRERIDRGERSICDRADSTRVAEHNEFLRQVMSEVGRLPRGQRDAIMARCLNEVPEWRYAIEI